MKKKKETEKVKNDKSGVTGWSLFREVCCVMLIFSVAQVSAAAGGVRSVGMKAPPALTGLAAALRAGNCENMGTDRANYPSDDFYEFPMKVMTLNWPK